MINSYAFDVEILPNFFSITFISINSYLNIFNECRNIKNKAIPLIQKYTVAEIKEKLDKVEKYKFYITDKDDSQLLKLIAFINNLTPHYNKEHKAIRNDLFGYNSNAYDKLMIAGFLMFANQCNNTKELITKLYNLSQKIISLQDNEDMSKRDYFLDSLRKYNLPFTNIDVMTIFALNKVGKINKDGKTIYIPKGLKQTSINLQWYELLEYELPPITEKDADIYRKKIQYKHLTAEQINSIVSKWDRYILDEWIDDMMHYNENDVFIVCEIVRLYIDEIRLRYSISKAYGIDALSSSRSNIADRLFIKFYSEFSGLAESQWRGKKTERTAMSLKKVIFPFISFKTKQLQELLEELKQTIIYSLGKKALKDIAKNYPNFKYLKTNTTSGWFEVTINKLTYSIATGGLHSQDVPRELKSKLEYIDSFTGECKENNKSIWDSISDNSYIYIHFDISSFYPSIMAEYTIAPKHIDERTFAKLIKWLRDTRIQAKHSKEEYIDGIPKDILAQALKIVINSIYGKLSYEYGDICDRLATLKVTINGQLMIMMLCEELELNNIEVMSANTDGIVVKLYKKDKTKFDTITNTWMEKTKLSADSEEYECYINRDIKFIGVLTV